mmetsp:Transcript_1537/g.6079  ORF Transcript_1537/g.6079 Transcript_1537/m.6079 type:complete len:212 (-) Transcript_1537:518-1153(-)
MMPGRSANWRRTSLTTSCALRPTAMHAMLENRNTSMAPRSPPTKTSGTAMSTLVNGTPEKALHSSMKALKSRKQASAAEPIAKPFVVALVVLPTASRRSVTSRTCSGCWLISTIPPALSAMGPNTSIVKTYTAVLSIPIVATAVPKRPPVGTPRSSCKPLVRPSQYAEITAALITSTGRAVDSSPRATPAMTLVPWPVVHASATLRTGANL